MFLPLILLMILPKLINTQDPEMQRVCNNVTLHLKCLFVYLFHSGGRVGFPVTLLLNLVCITTTFWFITGLTLFAVVIINRIIGRTELGWVSSMVI